VRSQSARGGRRARPGKMVAAGRLAALGVAAAAAVLGAAVPGLGAGPNGPHPLCPSQALLAEKCKCNPAAPLVGVVVLDVSKSLSRSKSR
jgi:hypothetical protein